MWITNELVLYDPIPIYFSNNDQYKYSMYNQTDANYHKPGGAHRKYNMMSDYLAMSWATCIIV